MGRAARFLAPAPRVPRAPRVPPRLVLAALVLLGAPTFAEATGKDLQAWPLVRVQHGIGERWAVALTGRGRWNDNLSHRKDWLLRPYVMWTPVEDVPFIDSLKLMVGYDRLQVNDGRDEHRAWQAIHHTPKRGPFGAVHRARLDERWISGLDEVIWRFRYRLMLTQQLFETSFYGRLSDELFVNLNDDDKGPVGGFEGNRARLAVGSYVTDRIRLEGGYQFEYARRRSRTNEFRHTLFVELVISTGRLTRVERRKEAPVVNPASETDTPGASAARPLRGSVKPAPGWVKPAPGWVKPAPGWVKPAPGWVKPAPGSVSLLGSGAQLLTSASARPSRAGVAAQWPTRKPRVGSAE